MGYKVIKKTVLKCVSIYNIRYFFLLCIVFGPHFVLLSGCKCMLFPILPTSDSANTYESISFGLLGLYNTKNKQTLHPSTVASGCPDVCSQWPLVDLTTYRLWLLHT